VKHRSVLKSSVRRHLRQGDPLLAGCYFTASSPYKPPSTYPILTISVGVRTATLRSTHHRIILLCTITDLDHTPTTLQVDYTPAVSDVAGEQHSAPTISAVRLIAPQSFGILTTPWIRCASSWLYEGRCFRCKLTNPRCNRPRVASGAGRRGHVSIFRDTATAAGEI
jgi:hypothetical protein